jgi:hypothetical protein
MDFSSSSPGPTAKPILVCFSPFILIPCMYSPRKCDFVTLKNIFAAALTGKTLVMRSEGAILRRFLLDLNLAERGKIGKGGVTNVGPGGL